MTIKGACRATNKTIWLLARYNTPHESPRWTALRSVPGVGLPLMAVGGADSHQIKSTSSSCLSGVMEFGADLHTLQNITRATAVDRDVSTWHLTHGAKRVRLWRLT